MSQLIDLCGTPIQLDKIKDFRLVKRECLFYPAYQEMEEMTFSLFARLRFCGFPSEDCCGSPWVLCSPTSAL